MTCRRRQKKALLEADLERRPYHGSRPGKKALLIADLRKKAKEGITGRRPGEIGKTKLYWSQTCGKRQKKTFLVADLRKKAK